MAKNKHAKIGRPTKGEGPKLSNPDEVERLLVEGEVVPDEHGEAKRVWLTQRDVAARFGVAVSTIAAFAKEHRTTERREELRAQLDPPKAPPPPKVERSVEAPEPSDVVRASVEDSAEPARRRTPHPRMSVVDPGGLATSRRRSSRSPSWIACSSSARCR
jgi:hypothetical protein